MKNSLAKAQKKVKKGFFCTEDPITIFYLTGLKLSLGKLFLSSSKALLFVDGRYLQECQEHAPCEVVPLEDLKVMKGKEITFDEKRATHAQIQELKKWGKGVKAGANLVDELRMVKSSEEIKRMKKSERLLKKGFAFAKGLLEPGITEREVALEFEIFCRRNGAEKLSFDPIVAFGENSAKPHYITGKTKLKKNDVALLDFGVMVDDYASDMTRTHLLGKPSKEIVKIERVVKEAARAAIKLCTPGRPFGALDAAAREVMRREGLEKYFIHTLGHGIGLEVHESPRIKWDGPYKDLKLKKGMVFTVEPGLYVPGLGGVRHEDMVFIC